MSSKGPAMFIGPAEKVPAPQIALERCERLEISRSWNWLRRTCEHPAVATGVLTQCKRSGETLVSTDPRRDRQ
jgi:hypothetical protein